MSVGNEGDFVRLMERTRRGNKILNSAEKGREGGNPWAFETGATGGQHGINLTMPTNPGG